MDLAFTDRNISSICGRYGVKNRGSYLEQIRNVLRENAEKINPLGAIFSANNVSSMLNGAGARLPEALTALTDNRETLEELVQQSGFSANNISGMLHGAGARLPEALTGLLNNPELVRRKLGTQKKR
jgi:hypothetical protein